MEEFVSKTGCDSLAIAIGTSHGAYKFKPGTKPQLRFDVLEEVSKRLPGFPIVLHGSSSVPQNYVEMINAHGGKMPGAIGVPEDQLRHAAELSVCKINIDSDLRLAMTGTIREFFDAHPDKFDPREYLKPARANIKELVRHKLVNVLGCAGRLIVSSRFYFMLKNGRLNTALRRPFCIPTGNRRKESAQAPPPEISLQGRRRGNAGREAAVAGFHRPTGGKIQGS